MNDFEQEPVAAPVEPVEPVEEVNPVEAPQEPDGGPSGDPELESEARKYGWRPKSEYTNDPEGWVEAEKFMGFQSTQRKVLNDRLREVESNIDNTVAERVSGIEKMLQAQHEAQLQRQRDEYDQRLAQLKEAQKSAVEVADVDAYDQASRAIDSLQPPPQAAQTAQPQDARIVEEFKAKNEWTRDPVMWNAAIQAVDNAKIPMSVEDQIRLGEHAVKQAFPEKFKKPEPPKQKVDGGGLGAPAKKSKGVADLPPEARKQGKEFVADGVFKDMEEYTKEYFSHLGE